MFNLSQRSEENRNTTNKDMVLVTKDYNLFKYVHGNRDINEGNVNAIAHQIRLRGQQVPILVNEKYEVIDGQHRLEACKQLDKFVTYIVRKGANIHDVISTNIVGKKWSMNDYINRYASEGNDNYLKLKKFLVRSKQEGFSASTALTIARGSGARINYIMYADGKLRMQGSNVVSVQKLYNAGDDIKLGKFMMGDEEQAYKRMELVLKFKHFDFYNKKHFVTALFQAMRVEDFDVKTLLHHAQKYPSRFTNEPDTKSFVAMIERVYNYRNRNKLAIVHNAERIKGNEA